MPEWYYCKTCDFLFPGIVNVGALGANCEHPCVIEKASRAMVERTIADLAAGRVKAAVGAAPAGEAP